MAGFFPKIPEQLQEQLASQHILSIFCEGHGTQQPKHGRRPTQQLNPGFVKEEAKCFSNIQPWKSLKANTRRTAA
jgi:hypothetical protein